VVTREANISNSLICNGCLVRGEVRSSILSPGVKIERGARVENSILFHECTIGAGAEVVNAIIDKGSTIGSRAKVGFGNAGIANELQPAYLDFGVTLIGKRTVIPAGVRIGTNCLVSGTLNDGLMPKRNLPDGGFFIAGEARP
jgi:glucose-1-phosphate adenylyltransferase